MNIYKSINSHLPKAELPTTPLNRQYTFLNVPAKTRTKQNIPSLVSYYKHVSLAPSLRYVLYPFKSCFLPVWQTPTCRKLFFSKVIKCLFKHQNR